MFLQGRQPLVLPKLPKPAHSSRSRFGFGYSPSSDEYQVFRCNETNEGHNMSIEVCTLGRDDTWRRIGGGHDRKPFRRSSTSLGIDFVFVNGALYGLGEDMASRLSLCYFDMDNEELGSTLPLPCDNEGLLHLGVLDNFLFLSSARWLRSDFNVWVMRDYIATGVWTLKWVVKLPDSLGLIIRPAQPIKFLKDGTVLMISSNNKVLAHNPQTGLTEIIKYHKVAFWTETIAHTPSFLCPPWLL
ncbi:hypothetical protein RHMOL_Rhmol04G0065600 [Rhododendron molle]|uniref:Uncharacterized protein n=1 Tax=Rhododendron molle TaxID=49168 RepID=A0ACC0NXX8_RHOML|nr:hypothetical protein RHMOL_Rhmol04G0065600 [Rhododendron molle]